MLTALIRRSLLAAAALLAAAPAAAYPGSVRWGYGNCGTCHFNVAGGGLLTPYGRQLSRELLSTWGSEREAEFAYGRLPLPGWLAAGGDVSFVRTAKASEAGDSLHLRQADLEAVAVRGRFLALATLGAEPEPSGARSRGLYSRRHYLQFSPWPKLSLRGGRFRPNHGVFNGDPAAAPEAAVGWDRGTYNFEANWVDSAFNLSLTAIAASADGRPAEKGVSLSGGVFFASKRKVWLGLASRGDGLTHRRQATLSAVVGIGARAYLLSEGNLQRRHGGLSPPATDLFWNNCLARETVKGLYVLAVDEASWTDLGGATLEGHTYGIGLRWFPRSHFEAQLRYRRRHGFAVSPPYYEGTSLMVHFYP